eukprot:scaffold99671_cov20-Tisochrysis_lutea.AAC.3
MSLVSDYETSAPTTCLKTKGREWVGIGQHMDVTHVDQHFDGNIPQHLLGKGRKGREGKGREGKGKERRAVPTYTGSLTEARRCAYNLARCQPMYGNMAHNRSPACMQPSTAAHSPLQRRSHCCWCRTEAHSLFAAAVAAAAQLQGKALLPEARGGGT